MEVKVEYVLNHSELTFFPQMKMHFKTMLLVKDLSLPTISNIKSLKFVA